MAGSISLTSRLSTGDLIALFALILSILSVSWHGVNYLLGPRLEFLSMTQRIVELRCHSSRKIHCWGNDNLEDSRSLKNTGRLVVILPIFFVNKGAIGYNGVIRKVVAKISYGTPEIHTIELVANQIWRMVQEGRGQQSRPFVPFVIEGGSANGSELRFVALRDRNFVSWNEFSGAIIGKKITNITMDVEAYVVGEKEPLRQSCRLSINDRLRRTLEERMKSRSGQTRLTTACN